MKKIVFLGSADKSHVLLALGRLWTGLGQKVLLVDSTMGQAVQGYLPPAFTGSAVQEFEDMDVAYGYVTAMQLERALEQAGTAGAYDVLLLDTDHTQMVTGRDLPGYDKRIWCWDGKRLSLQKNEELLLRLCLHEAEAPLSFYEWLSPALPVRLPAWQAETRLRHVEWLEPSFHFPLDERDATVDVHNQHQHRLDLRGVSGAFRQGLLSMLQQLAECDAKAARRAWAMAQKRWRVW